MKKSFIYSQYRKQNGFQRICLSIPDAVYNANEFQVLHRIFYNGVRKKRKRHLKNDFPVAIEVTNGVNSRWRLSFSKSVHNF